MRQELAMIKTSPRMMIGYEGSTSGVESPHKTMSDAYSIEAAPIGIGVDPHVTQPTPARRGKQNEAQGGDMSPQGGGFFMTQSNYNNIEKGHKVPEE